MSDGYVPVIPPPPGQQDNVYLIDPGYALIFTYVWVSVAVAAIIYRSPKLLRRLRRTWAKDGVNGWVVYEDLGPVAEKEGLMHGEVVQRGPSTKLGRSFRWIYGVHAAIRTVFGWNIKYLKLSVGQVFLLVGFTGTLLACLLDNSELLLNSNRAGFMVLSLIPPVFLLSTKNSLLAFLLSMGYEKLNFLHRWAGRAMFALACVHGGLWINNRIINGLSYLLLTEDKERRGITTITTLGLIVIFSLKPFRVFAYQYFFAIHVMLYVAFFVCLNYHTPYATPWIFPALAFYGWDLAIRMLRLRVKDANLIAVDNQMTLIHIPDASGGWRGGQIIRLRVFVSNRVFESHPFSILNSPAPATDSSRTQGMLVGARVNGDWTRAINRLGNSKVWVMLDGPYGGVHMSPRERVLCVSGGCGATFTLGVLDELISAVERGDDGVLREVEWVWFIRSYDFVNWFIAQLQSLAVRAHALPDLSLQIRIFLTCPCGDPPELLASIPNCDVTTDKPRISGLLEPLLDFTTVPDEEKVLEPNPRVGGGVAVVCCGPELLVRDSANAVAAVGPSQAARCGGVEVHVERFSL